MPPTEEQNLRAQLTAAGAAPDAINNALSLLPANTGKETDAVNLPASNTQGSNLANLPQPDTTEVPAVDSTALADTGTGTFTPEDPTTTPIPSTQGILDAIQQETPAQTQQDDLTEQLSGLIGELGDESAFRAQQQEQFGIDRKQQTVTDLTNRLRQIQAEEQQIPLQVQEEFEGRGVTQGGVRPIQAGRLRKNAIRSLGVSASLQAAQGNLATAQDQVDRAVEQEFGPIRDRIEALQANLELIQPQLNREQKQRAEALNIQLDERKRLINEQQAEKEQIYNTMTEAAAAGADAQTIQKIQNAETAEQALSIATEAGVFQQETTDISGLARAVQSGRMDITNVPAEFRSQVANQVDFSQVPIDGGGGGEAPDPISFTTNDEQDLLRAGFTQEDIIQIESDVSQYGLAAVLEGVSSEEQKTAIRAALGEDTDDTVNPIEFVDTVLNEEDFANYAERYDLKTGGLFGFGAMPDTEAAKEEIREIVERQIRLGTPKEDIIEAIRNDVQPVE